MSKPTAYILYMALLALHLDIGTSRSLEKDTAVQRAFCVFCLAPPNETIQKKTTNNVNFVLPLPPPHPLHVPLQN